MKRGRPGPASGAARRPSKASSSDGKRDRPRKTTAGGHLTVTDLVEDPLTPLATRFWAPGSSALAPFSADLIETLYYSEIIECNVATPRVSMLEVSSYLENYLWRHFDPATASYAHIMSIVVMLNEKFREGVQGIWSSLSEARDESTLKAFLSAFLGLRARFTAPPAGTAPPRHPAARPMERVQSTLFLTHLYTSLHEPSVRAAVLGTVSLPLWRALASAALADQLDLFPELAGQWKKVSSAKNAGKFAVETVLIPLVLEEVGGIVELLGSATATRTLAAAYAGSAAAASVPVVGARSGDLLGESGATNPLAAPLPVWVPAVAAVETVELAAPEAVAPASAPAEAEGDDKGEGEETKGKGKGKKGKGKKATSSRKSSAPAGPTGVVTVGRPTTFFSLAPPAAAASHDLSVLLLAAERALELCVDLVSQLPTRRFVRPLLADAQAAVVLRLSPFVRGDVTVGDAHEDSSSSSSESDDGSNSDSGSSSGSSSDSSSSSSSSSSDSDDEDKVPSKSRAASAPTRRLPPSPAALSAPHSRSPRLLRHLLSLLDAYLHFPVDDKAGTHVTDSAAAADSLARFAKLQQVAYRSYPQQLEPLVLATARDALRPSREMHFCSLFSGLSDDELAVLVTKLGLRAGDSGLLGGLISRAFPSASAEDSALAAVGVVSARRSLLLGVLAAHHCERPRPSAVVGSLPLYPTEAILWDSDVVPESGFSGDVPLALPKLSLQFLTVYDYLWRCFHLYRQEAAGQVRSDVVDTVTRMRPARVASPVEGALQVRGGGIGAAGTGAAGSQTTFYGRSPMALPVVSFKIASVMKPKLGSAVPERVVGHVSVDLALLPPAVRQEWEEIGEHSVFFLLGVHALPEESEESNTAADDDAMLPAPAAPALPGPQSLVGAANTVAAVAASAASGAGASRQKRAAPAAAADDAAEPKRRAGPAASAAAGTARAQGRHHAAAPSAAEGAAALGIRRVRGCEVMHVLDETGAVIGAPEENGAAPDSAVSAGEKITVRHVGVGTRRTYVVALDPAQFQADTDALAAGASGASASAQALLGGAQGSALAAAAATAGAAAGSTVGALASTVGLPDAVLPSAGAAGAAGVAGATGGDEFDGGDVYGAGSFTLLMRRRPQEGNFRAVLATIRDLLDEEQRRAQASSASGGETGKIAATGAVPTWLHDVFVGYGDAAAASYYGLAAKEAKDGATGAMLKFADTFVSEEHLADSFTAPVEIEQLPEDSPSAVASEGEEHEVVPTPFALTFPPALAAKRPDFAALTALLTKNLRKYTRPTMYGGIDPALLPSGFLGSDAPAAAAEKAETGPDETITARRYEWVQARDSAPRRNTVRFTPTQVEAVRAGLSKGLTLIVGPPGTGKTDTAVQILSELVHSHPSQRTLLVTHSNHALNDLFAKLAQRDVDERYLLRLGHGQAALADAAGGADYSKFGRVNHMLQRRLSLLETVGRLAQALGVSGDVSGYTCETAGLLYEHHVRRRWAEFTAVLARAEQEAGGAALADAVSALPAEITANSALSVASSAAAAGASRPALDSVIAACERAPATAGAALSGSQAHSLLTESFPFAAFFGPIFPSGGSYAAHKRAALAAFEELRVTFAHLEETRPFEILRTFRDRGDFLVSHHARVIALTCTHAAIRRKAFLELGLRYDNVVIEEAGQVLDIETLIPLLLQKPDPELGQRLQRVVLLGDHNQLPPVVQNAAFQRYARFDQSLFTRLVRLGVPAVTLNAQGRMRPELAALWAWRYPGLVSLPLALGDQRFALANCGMAHETQFIDVGAESGAVESTPQPHFIQNLAEAEYAVHLFMFLRLMGHAASSISILTTYNGQKALLHDVVRARCSAHPLYGSPAHIATVDEFQGQQNDIVIASLVRTRTLGHVRDVRRLIVAFSRARLGLYVLGSGDLFRNSLEFARFMQVWGNKPTRLQVCPGERNAYGWTPRLAWDIRTEPLVGVDAMPPNAVAPAAGGRKGKGKGAAGAAATAAAAAAAAGARGRGKRVKALMSQSLEEYQASIVANGAEIAEAMVRSQEKAQAAAEAAAAAAAAAAAEEDGEERAGEEGDEEATATHDPGCPRVFTILHLHHLAEAVSAIQAVAYREYEEHAALFAERARAEAAAQAEYEAAEAERVRQMRAAERAEAEEEAERRRQARLDEETRRYDEALAAEHAGEQMA